MKRSLFTLLMALFVLSAMNTFAKNTNKIEVPVNDSLKQYLQVEFSLFYEDFKKDYFESAYPHGWNVINTNPTDYVKFRIFRKMDEVLWYMYDSVATAPEEKMSIADTTLYLYDVAFQYNPELKKRFMPKRAFIIEVWKDAPVEEQIQAYLDAIKEVPDIQFAYKDRLGRIYATNADETNDYKLQALELYSAMSEAEPDNERWIQSIEALAEDLNELVDITGKAWKLDPENTEKAWKYASMAMRNSDYQTAVEPLEFLVKQAPDVVNYHRQLAKAYQNLEELEKAIASYKTLIELEPDNEENYYNIAILYQKMDQLSVARSYLYKASKAKPDWDLPLLLEAQLYEQAARSCGFEFMDRCVYQLASDTYARAAAKGGPNATSARDRVKALASSVPQAEDYFFRKLKPGDTVKIEGNCYGWVGKSITVPKK